MFFVCLGASPTVLNLAGAQPALPSVPLSSTSVPLSRPFAATPSAKPQPVPGQPPSSAPQPTAVTNFTQQPKPVMSFQPRLPSQTEVRPAFGPTTQPSTLPLFGGGQAFNLAKPKDNTELPKQPPPFTGIPSTRTLLPQSAESFTGSQAAGIAVNKSSLSSHGFNFGSPMGQSTPAPSASKVAAQLRFDTPPPTVANASVKTVSMPTAPVAAAKPVTAPVHPIAGEQAFQLNALYRYIKSQKCDGKIVGVPETLHE